MTSKAPSAELAEKISRLFKEKRLTLFAGAGVGVLAGLPDWQKYMESLASLAESYEPETAALMRTRMRAELYPEAAHYYKTCALIPRSEKFAKIAEPFKKYDPSKLRCLANLPSTRRGCRVDVGAARGYRSCGLMGVRTGALS